VVVCLRRERLCSVNIAAPRTILPSMRPVTTDGVLIAAASSGRPSRITASLIFPASGSSAGPSSAASSTSTSGPHGSPGQDRWPSSGTPACAAGSTPIPCLRCNEKIEFAAVIDKALAHGFTGKSARATDI
jgi:hypothetical protein